MPKMLLQRSINNYMIQCWKNKYELISLYSPFEINTHLCLKTSILNTKVVLAIL